MARGHRSSYIFIIIIPIQLNIYLRFVHEFTSIFNNSVRHLFDIFLYATPYCLHKQLLIISINNKIYDFMIKMKFIFLLYFYG